MGIDRNLYIAKAAGLGMILGYVLWSAAAGLIIGAGIGWVISRGHSRKE